MRTLIIASLAIALNFSHAAVAQAEQGCPDGYAPSVGTPGQQLHPALAGVGFDAVFDKGSYEAAYSGFEGTIGGHSDGDRLSAWLRLHGITAVDVCGIATDYCVRATALDAAAEGFATRVLAALTAAVHPVNVPAVEAELAEAGVTSTG